MTTPDTPTARTTAVGEVHHVEYGGPDGRTFVLVHGLGGSHLNWDVFAPLLVPHGRVHALDLPGFGLSNPAGRPNTMRHNLTVLARYVRGVADGPVTLVGNSMGGLLSTHLAARLPHLVDRLVLVNPALMAPSRIVRFPRDAVTFAAHGVPGIGEAVRRRRRTRLGAHETLRESYARCGVQEHMLPGDLFERTVALVARQSDVAGMDRAFLTASRSLAWTLARGRAYRTLMEAVAAPVLLLHGDEDEIVPVDAARIAARRMPGWRYVELDGVGHLPQLQVPDRLAGHVLGWLAEQDQADQSAPRAIR